MVAIEVPSLEDLLPLEGRRVLLRADFNVPMQDGRITEKDIIPVRFVPMTGEIERQRTPGQP